MDKSQSWLKPGWPLMVILIVVSYTVYSHTIHFPFFTLDDGAYILINENVTNLTLDSFLYFWINSKIPIPYSIWQITFAIFGENASAFRFLNIFTHGITSYMVFKVLYLLSSQDARKKFPFILFFITIFFLIHPMNVESVVWVSSLNGILSLLFGLMAYEQYIKIEKINEKESTVPILLSILYFTFSLLSKPVTAVFPIIFIITDAFILNRNVKEKWWLFLYYFSLTIALSLLHVQGIDNEVFKYIDWNDRLFIAANSFYFYFLKVLFPLKLYVIYPDSILDILKSFSSFNQIKLLFFLLTIIFLTTALWINKRYIKIAVGVIFFFIFLIPTSGIIPFEYQQLSYVADRYTYHSIFALSFILLFTGYNLFEKRSRLTKIISYISIAFIVLLGFKNFSYSAKWAKTTKVLKDSYEEAPNNSYLSILYANANTNEYQLEEAISILNGVYKRDPYFNETLSTIVDTFTFRCDPDRNLRVLGLLERSKISLPIEILLQKANLHISVGEHEHAFNILKYIKSSDLKLSKMAASLLEVTQKNLDNIEADNYMKLGHLNYRNNNYNKALEYFEKGKKSTQDNGIVENFHDLIQMTKRRIDEK